MTTRSRMTTARTMSMLARTTGESDNSSKDNDSEDDGAVGRCAYQAKEEKQINVALFVA